MPSDTKEIPSGVTKGLKDWLLTERITTFPVVEPLAGDGSTRCFYRLRWEKETRILLSDPEWIFSKDYAAHQAYLTGRNIPVPQFFFVDPKQGFLVMEDLGDELLQIRLKKDPAKKMHWLKEAVRLLARLHGETFPVPGNLPVSTRHFDQEKYFQELRFTQEHLSEKFLGFPPLSKAALSQLESFCAKVARVRPEAFSHRDYHTRNLLVHRDTLFAIDFQDARMGAPHYDVASLLYDAYVPVSTEEKDALLQEYQTTLRGFPKLYEKIRWEQFQEDLAWVAYQRMVKAAGSFAYFFNRSGSRTHLPYLVPALESARSLAQAFPTIREAVGDSVNLEGWLSKIRS